MNDPGIGYVRCCWLDMAAVYTTSDMQNLIRIYTHIFWNINLSIDIYCDFFLPFGLLLFTDAAKLKLLISQLLGLVDSSICRNIETPAWNENGYLKFSLAQTKLKQWKM